jgi:putative nucleotidyltransferase with HDIG domain
MVRMDRNEAFEELKLRLCNQNLIKHSLAVEAIMRELAGYFLGDVELWGLAGLLHDIDYERTADSPELHSIVGAEILENLGIDEAVVYSVRAHNGYHSIPRKRRMDKALYAADYTSVLIKACALIMPDKKLSEVTVDFILKKMESTSFANGVDRDQIRTCSELELTLEKFLELSLNAMKKVAAELDL